jgi:tripartite-type tricarboxylate transporter receptor subunit TctC
MVRKRMKHTLATRIAAGLVAVAAGLALAGCNTGTGGGAEPTTDFPKKPINLYIGYEPGGSGDPIAREYAELLSEELGVTVTVQNRPGGSGAVSTTEVLGKKPDGYTIALAPASQLSVTPLLSSDALTYSGPDDWTTIGGVLSQQNGLMVRPDSGWKTVDDFIDAAKERPGELTVGVASVAGANAMGVASLAEVAGIKVKIVPFSGGSGEASVALLGGQIDAMNGTLSGQLGLLQSGDLISLGHSGDQPYTAGDSVPFSESGYTITSLAETVYYLYGPKDIPEDVLGVLAAAHEKILSGDEFQEWLDKNGYLVHATKSEEAKAELEQAGKDAEEGVTLLKSAGLDLG